jgi:hypothetical protein
MPNYDCRDNPIVPPRENGALRFTERGGNFRPGLKQTVSRPVVSIMHAFFQRYFLRHGAGIKTEANS